MKLTLYIYSSFILTMLLGTLMYASISSVLASSNSNTTVSAIKTDNVEVTKPGEILTYSIILKNTSSEDITIQVIDILPEFLIPMATSPEATANADTRTITWEQIVVPASQEVTVGLQAQVLDTTPNDQIIENRAQITGNNIDVIVSDTTRVEAIQEISAAPIQPTAQTGTSDVVLIVSVIAIAAGLFGGRKVLSHLS